jgi:hypothetical protein
MENKKVGKNAETRICWKIIAYRLKSDLTGIICVNLNAEDETMMNASINSTSQSIELIHESSIVTFSMKYQELKQQLMAAAESTCQELSELP